MSSVNTIRLEIEKLKQITTESIIAREVAVNEALLIRTKVKQLIGDNLTIEPIEECNYEREEEWSEC
jgi:hypothetical protein